MAVNLAPAETSTSRIVAAIRSVTQQLEGTGILANPTATIGLTAINGSAATGLRSDGAPALSQAIVPTWTALHTFSAGLTSNGPLTSNGSATLAGFTSSAASRVNAAFVAYSVNGAGYIAPGIVAPNGATVAGNGTTDDSSAINSILSTYNTVICSNNAFGIGSPINLNASNNQRLIGSPFGTTFIGLASFSGAGVLKVTGVGGADIVNLFVVNKTAGSGSSYGIFITASGDFSENICFNNVVSSGFAFNWLLQSTSNTQFCRLLNFIRCGAWPNDDSNATTTSEFGWYFFAETGGFVGDMDFISCQVVSSNNSGQCFVFTDQSGGTGEISGIRFNYVTTYYGSFHYNMGAPGAGSIVSDIWINPGCQMEGAVGGSSTAVRMVGVEVKDIHIQGTYMSGNGFTSHVIASATTLEFIWILDNFLANPNGTSISITGGNMITVAGNQVYGSNTATVVFNFVGTIVLNCENNLMYQVVQVPIYFIQSTGNGCNFVGNNSGTTGAVYNLTGSPVGNTGNL